MRLFFKKSLLMNTRRNKKIVRSLKDYIAPIVGGLLLVFLLYSVFSWSDEATPTPGVKTPITIDLNPENTEAYIEYSGGKKTKIENGWADIYPGEKLSLSNAGSAKMTISPENTIHLNKLGSMLYESENTFSLYGADAFVKTSLPSIFHLRYMTVDVMGENQVFNLTQNEVASTIYVLNGSVEVKNTAGVGIIVAKWEKLSILKNDANKKDVDLNGEKELIDDYIKTDEWYVLNAWDTYLNTVETTATGTISGTWTETLTGSVALAGSVVAFDILDESDSDKEFIDISGKLLDTFAYKVEINGQTADVNSADRTFLAKGVKLTGRVNDIVYRVFDEGNKLLDKWVITVYYSKGISPTETPASLAGVENYSLSKSPLYTIISPKSNPYITTENNVRIEGAVPARTVEKIVINDFQLQKFPKYGTYWYYFANEEFGNLKEGLNIYKIQYFGADNKIIFENTFTIVKEAPKAVVTPVVETPTSEVQTTTETVSGEVQAE